VVKVGYCVVSDRAIQILLVHGDPIFLEGLKSVLTAEGDFDIMGQAQGMEEAQNQLPSLTNRLNLVVLDMALERDRTKSIGFCQSLKQSYPNLPLLVLSSVSDPKLLRSLRRLGVEGYACKGTPVPELVNALRQVARGELYWQQGIGEETTSLQLPPASFPQPVSPPRWLTRQREVGLAEIQRDLAQVEAHLAKDDLSTFDWLFWKGRKRELTVAQWLVKQLLPVEVVVVNNQQSEAETDDRDESNLEPSVQLESSPNAMSDTLLQTTLGKIQLGLVNTTGMALEIDILNEEKKRELLYIVVQQFQKQLNQLAFVQLSVAELSQQQSQFLREWWQSCLTQWLTKYIWDAQSSSPASSLADFALAQTPENTLNRLPHVTSLLAYLLYQAPLEIDQVAYRPESPEAQARAEMLFHHGMLQVANAVMQVILNQFGEQERVKTTLYQESYRSSREIARFRNELSSQNLQWYYLDEPKAIFESRYPLLILRGNRIQLKSIYAPRQQELEQLNWIRWGITMTLELRDAIGPKLRSIFGVVGQGLIYVLTDIIGRGIGLIGRGILQGIGKTVEDQRDRRS